MIRQMIAALVVAAPAFAQQSDLEVNLAKAEAVYAADTTNADAIIWLGRRHAYLGHYRQAIDVFTKGIRLHPDDARLYRHRGHRYITLREFDKAIADFDVAVRLIHGKPDEIEPDGAPNKYNIPTSTLHSNIWYHYALAYYLKGDFAAALNGWWNALKVSTNDDMRVASTDWLYMTLRRMDRPNEAKKVLEAVRADMKILENTAYHRRLLMYKGELKPDQLLAADSDDAVQVATYGYGVANWYLYNGEREKAFALFRKIVDGKNPAAFGYIAAEQELKRGR